MDGDDVRWSLDVYPYTPVPLWPLKDEVVGGLSRANPKSET